MYNNGCVVTKGGSLVSVFDMLYHANTIVHACFRVFYLTWQSFPLTA